MFLHVFWTITCRDFLSIFPQSIEPPLGWWNHPFWAGELLCFLLHPPVFFAELSYSKWPLILWFALLKSRSGWWFGTFFIFPYIGNSNPNWLIFFRWVETTNQRWYAADGPGRVSSTCNRWRVRLRWTAWTSAQLGSPVRGIYCRFNGQVGNTNRLCPVFRKKYGDFCLWIMTYSKEESDTNGDATRITREKLGVSRKLGPFHHGFPQRPTTWMILGWLKAPLSRTNLGLPHAENSGCSWNTKTTIDLDEENGSFFG